MNFDGDAVAALRTGDVTAVRRLLAADPALVAARGPGGRTALHVVTDWPGYYPQAPAMAGLLLEAGADPNARTSGRTTETPLHWAASSDDVEVAEVLIAGGADIEAPDGSIGTPLANAVGYGCWHVARLLVAQGAEVPGLWQAAALGMTDRVRELMAEGPDQAAIDQAFWHACQGGQRRTAEYLLAAGADLNARPDYAGSGVLEAAISPDTRRALLGDWIKEQGPSGSD
jgi:ankyrin repeat protein